MDKETTTTITQKTTWEKSKESFGTALMSAGIVLVVLFLIWVPLSLIPSIYGNGSKYVSTTLSSMLIPNEATSTEENNLNDTTSKSANTQPVTTSATPNTVTTYSNAPVQPAYYGKSDLEITLVNTGIIDPATKQYIQTNYAGFNDEIAIRFQVKNIGTNVSGNWKLRINSPSRTTPYYDSDYQQSIRPGDRMIFTTSFNSPVATGVNTVYITVDPLSMIDEYSKTNNQLIVPVNVQGTYYSYNNNYNYGSNVAVPNVPYGTLYTWTNMNINCYPSVQASYMGNVVTWYATASGGNGYYSYSWIGSDGLYSNESNLGKIYYSSGQKYATVTVTSGGQSLTKQCSTYIY